MAHGERMEKGEDAAAAAEKVEDGDKDTTIVLSDDEMKQFVTVMKKKRKKEGVVYWDNEKRIMWCNQCGAEVHQVCPGSFRFRCSQCEEYMDLSRGRGWRRRQK